MANFAQIGLNNKVISVTSVDDSVITDSNGVEREDLGVDFLSNLTGWAIWKRTFEDGSQRARYAGKGFIYNEEHDVFMFPKPHASWVIDTSDYSWKAPVPYPTDGEYYIWNETTGAWQDAEIVPNNWE